MQVSWFRKEDDFLHVLTIGKETFSADQRYASAFKEPYNWRLKIKPTQTIDDGTYLCQISTHPPTILVTNLQVIGKFSLFLYSHTFKLNHDTGLTLYFYIWMTKVTNKTIKNHLECNRNMLEQGFYKAIVNRMQTYIWNCKVMQKSLGIPLQHSHRLENRKSDCISICPQPF